MLEPIGVTGTDERLYLALLENPDASVDTLSRHTKYDRDELNRALARLTEMGLLRTTDDGYTPIDPKHAIRALMHRRQSEIEKLGGESDRIAEIFSAATLRARPESMIDIVSGAEQIAQRARELFDSATTRVMGFDQPPYATPLAQEVENERRVLKRGVRVQVLYSHDALSIPERLQAITTLTRLGEPARTVPQLPMKLSIYDHTAIVPLTSDRHATNTVAIVRRSGLLNSLIALFDAYWRAALPVGAPEPPEGVSIGEQEAVVLQMLYVGLTDERMARHLRVSLRTIRRCLHTIQTALRANTRFQAGCAAERHGLLPTGEPKRVATGSARE